MHLYTQPLLQLCKKFVRNVCLQHNTCIVYNFNCLYCSYRKIAGDLCKGGGEDIYAHFTAPCCGNSTLPPTFPPPATSATSSSDTPTGSSESTPSSPSSPSSSSSTENPTKQGRKQRQLFSSAAFPVRVIAVGLDLHVRIATCDTPPQSVHSGISQ